MIWNAADFFRTLTLSNRFARSRGFRFFRVSSLDGFHDALSGLLDTNAFVAVSDESQGHISLDNAPGSRRIKTVFLAMRHPVDDMAAREARLSDMRELFRQFASRLILEKTRLENDRIFIDSRISFTEISRYFFSGCACAYYQIAVEQPLSLVFNPDDWQPVGPDGPDDAPFSEDESLWPQE